MASSPDKRPEQDSDSSDEGLIGEDLEEILPDNEIDDSRNQDNPSNSSTTIMNEAGNDPESEEDAPSNSDARENSDPNRNEDQSSVKNAVDDAEGDSRDWVEITDGSGGDAAELWGRFWGGMDNVAGAFYLLLDRSRRTIVTSRFAVYGSSAPLEDFHPRMDPEEFEDRILDYNVQSESVPTYLFENVTDVFEESLNREEAIEEIHDFLENQNQTDFRNWIRGIVHEIVDDEELHYQVRGQRVEDSNFAPSTDESEQVHSSNQDNESASKQLNVSILNNPTSGLPAEELAEDMDVLVRIVDDRVQQLPDHFIDDELGYSASIPIDAHIKEINTLSTLPPRIEDGDPEDFREVIVELEEEMDGRSIVYLEDRVKVKRGDDDEQSNNDSVDTLFIAGGLIIILIIIMVMFEMI